MDLNDILGIFLRSGAKKMEGQITVEGKTYYHKIYWVGTLIRLDLKEKED